MNPSSDRNNTDNLNVPYLAPLSPDKKAEMAAINSLPPIAMARPLNSCGAIPAPVAGLNSNIPIVNGVRQVPMSMPHVDSSNIPTDTAFDNPSEGQQAPPPQFEHMDKCRYTGGLMLGYYLCTFCFLQPFFLGTMGVLAGFLGFFGSRAPIFSAHVKWIRGYVWMNYVLLIMNMWYVGLMVFYFNHHELVARDDDGYIYDQSHLGLFIGLVVVLNLILHVQGLRTGRRFYAELLRSPFSLPGPRTVIIVGPTAV